YYQHTPTGELITVERIAQGRVVVDMGTLPSFGVPQVSAYDGNHAPVIERCTVIDGSLRVFVNSFDPNGNLLDEDFCVHYRVGGSDDERTAYLWASSSTSPSYTPVSSYLFNGNRAAPTITRTGTGVYQVLIPDLGEIGTSERGNVQVSAYSGMGNVSLMRAKVSSWATLGNDLTVTVRTFDATGAAADGRFTLNYQQKAGS